MAVRRAYIIHHEDWGIGLLDFGLLGVDWCGFGRERLAMLEHIH